MEISLSLENFLPFRTRQTLTLTNQGFVIVRGINQVSAALDANGVGKSAIWGALSAGWFGVDLNNRRGIDLACRHTSGKSEVMISVIDDKGPWSVTRTFRPSHTVTLDGFDLKDKEDIKDLQVKIEARLGFGLRTFRNAWIFGQGTFDRFARAEQGDQMRMLDEIQGVDFRVALDRAKAWRDSCDAQRRAYADQHRDAGSRLDQARESLEDLEDASARYEGDKRKSLANYEHRLRELGESVRSAQASIEDLTKQRKQVFKVRTDWEAYAKILSDRQTLNNEVLQSARQVSTLKERWHELSRELETLLAHPVCPTCKRGIKDAEDLILAAYGREAKALEEKKIEAEKILDHCQERYNTLEEIMGTALKVLPPGINERKVAEMEAAVSEVVQKRWEETLHDRQREMCRVETERDALRAKKWEGTQAIEAAKKTISEAEAEIATLSQQIKKAEIAIEVSQYWLEAFGDRGLRSLLFDSVAPFLSERLAYHLGALAGGEVAVPVSATKALKNGNTRERLTFTPTWTWGGQGVEAGSCGQDQRFNLALFAAIQDLAEARSARSVPLKIWDEPSMGIDARGRELLLDWIQGESRRRGSGFLITHDSDMAATANPDHVWTVILDNEGARIEVD